MNLRDLEYLVAVAQQRHFGKAALQTHVSQPTLSMQLKKLEAYLGVPLFERTNKQVRITPAGEEIARHARTILRDAQEIKDIAKLAQNPYAGDFRLGAFPTLAPYFLPLAIPVIRKKLPALKLFLTEEKTATLLDKIHAGTLDAALIALPIEEKGLEAAALLSDPFWLAVPHGHPLAKRKHITQEDIMTGQLLLLEEGHCLRNQALAVCSLAGTSAYEDFRATSLETLRQMVAAGVGITLIPALAKRKNDGIAYIPFARPVPSRTIGMVWRKTSARKLCIETLVELMSTIVKRPE